MRVGRLISASATTGWTDWIHGELSLLPDGLLRVVLDSEQTKQHGLGRTVPAELPTRTMADEQLAALVASDARNVWITADRIGRASLRTGLKTDRLKLWLHDGGTAKFLWLSADPASPLVREALHTWGIEV